MWSVCLVLSYSHSSIVASLYPCLKDTFVQFSVLMDVIKRTPTNGVVNKVLDDGRSTEVQPEDTKKHTHQPDKPLDGDQKHNSGANTSLKRQDVLVTADDEMPWSIWTSRQKKRIVLAASFAALLSPLSSQIYLPALDDLARDLHVSDTLVDLSITA